jgi:hypothetical protein
MNTGKLFLVLFTTTVYSAVKLSGIVEENEFFLPGFIGSGPTYYKGKFDKEGKLTARSMVC